MTFETLEIEDAVCPVCNGDGRDPDLIHDGVDDLPCPECGGTGWFARHAVDAQQPEQKIAKDVGVGHARQTDS